MKKITMKERVLRFVESKGGTARFSEIQEFIVDHNYGKGTYKQRVPERIWAPGGKFIKGTRMFNPWRGYYCCAFWHNGYFMRGDDRLVRVSHGLYKVVRKENPLKERLDLYITP